MPSLADLLSKHRSQAIGSWNISKCIPGMSQVYPFVPSFPPGLSEMPEPEGDIFLEGEGGWFLCDKPCHGDKALGVGQYRHMRDLGWFGYVKNWLVFGLVTPSSPSRLAPRPFKKDWSMVRTRREAINNNIGQWVNWNHHPRKGIGPGRETQMGLFCPRMM